MALTRLRLTNFRSYSEAVINPGSAFIVLTGENGAGKTNVLEAASLLVPGRGLRAAMMGEMARSDGPGGFGVSGDLDGVTLGTGTIAAAPERRLVQINGAAAPATALSEWLSVIWLTPAMDRLFTDSAGERRRFLDRLVLASAPHHARATARYEAAMRQRNRLLSEAVPADPDWLGALEAQMAEQSIMITQARSALVDALNEQLNAHIAAPFPRAILAIAGWSGTENLAAVLAMSRARDAVAGRTLVGPHRSDLSVTHATKNQPAARCSTGEQKALLLGIVLGHGELVALQQSRRPLLLLDEVAAHLDSTRREALFERLSVAGGQVWMTGTEATLFAGLGTTTTWLHVANGVVHN